MRFLVDAQLPPALVEWIGARGHTAEHVLQLSLVDGSDRAIWDAALDARAVILTKDHDFVEWATTRRPAPQIIWLRVGNATNAALTVRLGTAWTAILSDLRAGAKVVEVGRV